MFFYRNPLKWVNSLEISASSAWDPAELQFGERMAVSENQEIMVASAGVAYQDGGTLGFLSVLKKDEQGIYNHIQTIRPIGLGINASDNFAGLNLVLSKDGSTIVAGAPEPEPDWSSWQSESAEDYGAMVVFQSGSDGWVQTQTILTQEDLPYLNVLVPLALSDDGSRLVVVKNSYSESSRGKLHVYEKNISGSFELQQQIEPPIDNPGLTFGGIWRSSQIVSLEDMATFFLSTQEFSGSFSKQGAVYMYSSGSNGYELADIITNEDETGPDGKFGSDVSYSSQNNLLVSHRAKADWSGQVLVYQSGSSGFQKVQTIDNSVDENLNGVFLSEDGTTLLTTVYKQTNNPKNKRTVRFYQSGSTGFQPTGVELETDDTYTNWDFFAFPRDRLSYDTSAGRIVAGAIGYDVAGVGSQVGAIYVFDSGSNGWQQSQLITASDDWSPVNDVFGGSFELANNNEILAIRQNDAFDIPWGNNGSYVKRHNADSVGGSVYIYEKEGEGYKQTQRIQSPAPSIAPGFGSAISFTDSGDKLAMSDLWFQTELITGSMEDPVNWDNALVGKVYVYESGSSGYSLVQEIQEEPINLYFGFGGGIAFSPAGQNLFVSAMKTDTGGSIFVYETGSSGYTKTQELTSSLSVPGYEYFGVPVLSEDGQMLIASSQYHDSETRQNLGSLSIFISGSEGYEEVQVLQPDEDDTIDPDGYLNFGVSKMISGDNQTIAVASSYESVQLDQSVARSGAVRIYQSGSSGYEQVQLITAPAEDPVNGYQFGYSVDMSGSYLAVGSFADRQNESDGVYRDRGGVWIYEKINGTYEKKYRIGQEVGRNLQSTMLYNTGKGGFGAKVKFLPNNEILIGSPYDDKNGADSGVVYKYKLTRDY